MIFLEVVTEEVSISLQFSLIMKIFAMHAICMMAITIKSSKVIKM